MKDQRKDRRLLKSTASLVHFHNSTFLGNAQRVEINNGTSGQQKDYKYDIDTVSTLSNHGEDGDENEDSEEDDGESSMSEGDNSSETKAQEIEKLDDIENHATATEESESSGSEYLPTDEDEYDEVDPPGYRAAFLSIRDEDKFVLNTGKVVEDTLYNHGKGLVHEDALHSFIIDTDNEEVKGLFTNEEWNQITMDRLGTPPVTNEFASILARYEKGSLADLRKVVMESYLPVGETYNAQAHYDHEWVHVAIRLILNLWENSSKPLARAQLEAWFTSNVYSNLVDFGVRDPSLGMEVVRSEGTSVSSSNRKNRNRKLSERKMSGRRIDGLIREVEGKCEYGAFEASMLYDGKHDTKYLRDSLKLAKTMKDIFCDLLRAVDANVGKVENLQVVGMLHFRLYAQLTRMWRAGGCILVRKSETLWKLPEEFSPPGLRVLLMFLAVTWQMREIVRSNVKIIKSSSVEEPFMKEVLALGTKDAKKEKVKRLQIPDSLASPPKKMKRKRV